MSMTVQRFQSSELNRNPAAVFAAAEASPVLVTRRDGENLVLMTSAEAEAAQQLQQFAAQLLGLSDHSDEGRVAEMTHILPWMLALSPADQKRCAADLITATRAALATGQPQRVIGELLAWKETALAWAEGLASSSEGWSEVLELVERP